MTSNVIKFVHENKIVEIISSTVASRRIAKPSSAISSLASTHSRRIKDTHFRSSITAQSSSVESNVRHSNVKDNNVFVASLRYSKNTLE